ncbi:hypothetical protein [Vulcanococcus sp.]|jgi:hypothetical protein|uniref:hypothetical protein n=1 Tax=Vulcanococcus sp. TaxID=2856995 RepID=UPI0037DA2111
MTSYAVFFIDPAAIGMQRGEAADAAAAEEMVLDQHPDAQVHAVDGALVHERNSQQLVAAWLRRQVPDQMSYGRSVIAVYPPAQP